MLAERYHWPKTVVDEQDTDYMDELLTFIDAQASHAAIVRRREAQQARRDAMKGRRR
jgi:hypothetical protein